jgi:cytochrome c-type biogenesis protein CcmE
LGKTTSKGWPRLYACRAWIEFSRARLYIAAGSEKAMRRSRQRLYVIGAVGAVLALAAGLTLFGLREQVSYFYPPSEIAAKAKPGDQVRVGGLVVAGSIAQEADGAVAFVVTDNKGEVAVRYRGVPPDLFGENQGVVAEGVWRGEPVFTASRILAKHDENYMPKEVVEALKDSGEWKGK